MERFLQDLEELFQSLTWSILSIAYIAIPVAVFGPMTAYEYGLLNLISLSISAVFFVLWVLFAQRRMRKFSLI